MFLSAFVLHWLLLSFPNYMLWAACSIGRVMRMTCYETVSDGHISPRGLSDHGLEELERPERCSYKRRREERNL